MVEEKDRIIDELMDAYKQIHADYGELQAEILANYTHNSVMVPPHVESFAKELQMRYDRAAVVKRVFVIL